MIDFSDDRGDWLYANDPIMTPQQAAEYLGRSARTLRKLPLRRDPLPGTGAEWGYRRSTLNRYLHELAKKATARHFEGVQ